MSGASFSTEIVGGSAEVRRILEKAVANKFHHILTANLKTVRDDVATVVGKLIRQSQEYRLIITGDYWHELGIPMPEERMDAVIEQVMDSVSIRQVGSPVHLKAEFVIGILPADYQDILQLDAATYVSRVRKSGIVQATEVPWLRWLLLEGGKLVVAQYEYAAKASRKSRTGFGLMEETGGGWSVPAEIAGTPNDNFLIRPLLRDINLLKKAMLNSLMKVFS